MKNYIRSYIVKVPGRVAKFHATSQYRQSLRHAYRRRLRLDVEVIEVLPFDIQRLRTGSPDMSITPFGRQAIETFNREELYA